MEYNELLEKVKSIFIEHLQKVVETDAYRANPLLTHTDYINIVYTEIMSLGYNFGNIENAINDIYEMQSELYGELESEIRKGVNETAKLYIYEINVFSEFHKSYKNGTAYDFLLKNLTDKLK